MAGQSWTKHNVGKKIMFGGLGISVCDPISDAFPEKLFKTYDLRNSPKLNWGLTGGSSESLQSSGYWHNGSLRVSWFDNRVYMGQDYITIALGTYFQAKGRVLQAIVWTPGQAQRDALAMPTDMLLLLGVVVQNIDGVGRYIGPALRLYPANPNHIGNVLKVVNLPYGSGGSGPSHSAQCLGGDGLTYLWSYCNGGNQTLNRSTFSLDYETRSDSVEFSAPHSAYQLTESSSGSTSGDPPVFNFSGSATGQVISGLPIIARIEYQADDFYTVGIKYTAALSNGVENISYGSNSGSRSLTYRENYNWSIHISRVEANTLALLDTLNLGFTYDDQSTLSINIIGQEQGTFSGSSSFLQKYPEHIRADYINRVYLLKWGESYSEGSVNCSRASDGVSGYIESGTSYSHSLDYDRITSFKESEVIHTEQAIRFEQTLNTTLTSTQIINRLNTVDDSTIGNFIGLIWDNWFYAHNGLFSSASIDKLLLGCVTLGTVPNKVSFTFFIDPKTGTTDVQPGRVDDNPTASLKYGAVGVYK
jgi:hypothetical protein